MKLTNSLLFTPLCFFSLFSLLSCGWMTHALDSERRYAYLQEHYPVRINQAVRYCYSFSQINTNSFIEIRNYAESVRLFMSKDSASKLNLTLYASNSQTPQYNASVETLANDLMFQIMSKDVGIRRIEKRITDLYHLNGRNAGPELVIEFLVKY